MALFFAGKEGVTETNLLSFTQQDAYQRYKQEIKKRWDLYQQEEFLLLKSFANTELELRTPAPTTVCYFFGGPDILAPLALFPEAEVYFLVGLEPIGALPPLENFSNEKMTQFLLQLERASRISLKFGYAITEAMKHDLKSESFEGILPLFLLFLGLSGNEILNLSFEQQQKTPSITLTFKTASGLIKKLIYTQQDLSNRQVSLFLKKIELKPPVTSYLKAASYLLHEEEFSKAKNFLLTSSNVILEDDSGIPLKDFSKKNWSLFFFGNYKTPLPVFKKYEQPDLREALSLHSLIPELHFGTGYGFNGEKEGGSHFILAVENSFIPTAKKNSP